MIDNADVDELTRIVSYAQLLKRYHLEKEVTNFPASTTHTRGVFKPELMMFSSDTVVDIMISRNKETGLTDSALDQ